MLSHHFVWIKFRPPAARSEHACPTSGNVTPTPTTGELEELSISSAEQQTVVEGLSLVEDIRSSQGSRATPLKSLLKKPSVDLSSDSESEVK